MGLRTKWEAGDGGMGMERRGLGLLCPPPAWGPYKSLGGWWHSRVLPAPRIILSLLQSIPVRGIRWF